MLSEQVNNAVTWNPWHGCHKCSPGCKNCFVFKMDRRYGRDTSIVEKGKSTYYLDWCPPGSLVKLCFTSDLFIEEADAWRDGVWDQIRERPDLTFITTTKRPDRIKQCLPYDWEDGWDNVHISVSAENSLYLYARVQYLLSAPIKHREVFLSPLIAPVQVTEYIKTGLIECVNVGGEMASNYEVRPLLCEWVKDIFLECKVCAVPFYFHQTGSSFIRDGRNLGVYKLNSQIARAEFYQKELEEMYARGEL